MGINVQRKTWFDDQLLRYWRAVIIKHVTSKYVYVYVYVCPPLCLYAFSSSLLLQWSLFQILILAKFPFFFVWNFAFHHSHMLCAQTCTKRVAKQQLTKKFMTICHFTSTASINPVTICEIVSFNLAVVHIVEAFFMNILIGHWIWISKLQRFHVNLVTKFVSIKPFVKQNVRDF